MMDMCWRFPIFFVRTFRKKGLKDSFFFNLKQSKPLPLTNFLTFLEYSSFLLPVSNLFSPPDPLLHFPSDLLGISTKHGITRYIKTKHILSCQGWASQPGVGGKGSPRAVESEIPPLPLLGVSQKHNANNHNKYAEDLFTGPYNLCGCCFSF